MPLSIALIFSLVLWNISCDESLPPHEEPHSLFTGNLRIVYFNNTAKGTINELRIYLDARNVFDETLEDSAGLQGTLEIIVARDPVYRKTVMLSSANLVAGGSYDPRTGQLTIDSGDSLTLMYTWNFIDDNGYSIPRDVSGLKKDPQCPTRTYAPPEILIIRGSLLVFRRIGQTTFSPIQYVLNYFIGSC